MSKPRIQLSDHFTYPRLLRFVAPSITMMIFTSIYGVVDGFFVSNYVGKTPFAALNFIMPFIMVLGGTGFMLGTGGSALVAKEMGCGHTERANRIFTMMIGFVVVTGLILTVLGVAFIRPIARLMGASESIMADCVLYGRITIAFTTAFMLQNVFQSFLVVAERPRVGCWSLSRRAWRTWCSTRCSSRFSAGGWRARRWRRASANASAASFRQCISSAKRIFRFASLPSNLRRLPSSKPAQTVLPSL